MPFLLPLATTLNSSLCVDSPYLVVAIARCSIDKKSETPIFLVKILEKTK